MAYCDKGHYFDESRQAACPDCQRSGAAAKAPATSYEEPPQAGAPAWSGGGAAFGPGAAAGRFAAPPGPAFGGGPARQPPGGATVYAEADEAQARLMGFLVIADTKEDTEWRYFRLKKGVNHIGRFGSRAEIELRDSQCSNEHALLVCTESATRLIDLDSANSVAVNGDKVEIASLQNGDEVSVGRTMLTFVDFSFVADD